MSVLLVEAGCIGTLIVLGAGEALPPLLRALPLLLLIGGIIGGQLSAEPVRLRLMWPFVAFVAVGAASALFSSFPERSFRQVTAIPAAALLFVAAQIVATHPRSLLRIGWTAVGVSWLIGLDGLEQWRSGISLLGGVPALGTRLSASLPNPNDLGMLALFLPLSLFVLRRRPSWTLALLLAIASLPAVFTLIASQSRNAWLGAAVALLLMTVLWPPVRRPVLLLSVVIAAMTALLLLRDPGWFRERLASFTALGGEGRWGIFRVAWAMFLESPLLGRGPGTFIDHYVPWLERVEMAPGYAPELVHVPWAHNIELECLAERGVLGLATFLWLVVAALRSAWPGVRAPRDWPPVATVALIGLVVFLVMGQADLTFIKDWVMVVFWIYAGLSAQSSPRRDERDLPRQPAITIAPNAPSMSTGSSRSIRYDDAKPDPP